LFLRAGFVATIDAFVKGGAAVGWAEERSGVPTFNHLARWQMVGTLRFAHPTESYTSRLCAIAA
jgi:hypothetical protein